MDNPPKRKRKRTVTDSAKKRRKKDYMQRYRDQKKDECVYICGQMTRWNDFKTSFDCNDDEEVAKMLLDFFDRNRPDELVSVPMRPEASAGTPSTQMIRPTHSSVAQTVSVPMQPEASTSTPSARMIRPTHSSVAPMHFAQTVSEMSSISSGSGNDRPKVIVSEVSDEVDLFQPVQRQPSSAVNLSYSGHDIIQEQFELNVTVERVSDGAEVPVEEVYSPSDTGLTYDDDPADLTFVPDTLKINYRDANINYDNLEVIGEDDDDGDIDEVPAEEQDSDDADHLQELETESTVTSSYDDILKDKLSVAFDSKLLELATLSSDIKCPKCGQDMFPSLFHIGSSSQIRWRCSSGHIGRIWSSQQTFKKIKAGDFLLATNILLSGNNYYKISRLFDFLNLGCVPKSSFFRIQSTFCVPVINTYWDTMVTRILNDIRGKELVLLGDGQNDSPGHCAQYLNYNVIDNDTGLLVHVNTIDKRQTGGSSTKIELEGFKKALQSLKDNGQTIKDVVTDAHVQIKRHMAKQEPTIKHSNDIWHGAKSISKKISKATQKHENKPLAVWAKHTINHFWYCAKNCDGSAGKFLAIWRGHLQHVVNQHQWVSEDGFIEPKCNHDNLTGVHDDIWLKPGSTPHRALEKIVLDTRLIKSLPYFVNFSPPIYHARSLLAAVDFNYHANREPLKGADGNIKYRKKYSEKISNMVSSAYNATKDIRVCSQFN